MRRKPLGKPSHLRAEFPGIAIFEMSELAQSERLHRHGIRHESSQPPGPLAGRKAGFELGRVGTEAPQIPNAFSTASTSPASPRPVRPPLRPTDETSS